MSQSLEIEFAPLNQTFATTAAVLATPEMRLGRTAVHLDTLSAGALKRAAETAAFTGKAKSAVELLGHAELPATRLLVLGAGDPGAAEERDWLALGGYALSKLKAGKVDTISLVAELPKGDRPDPAELAACLAVGALLRSYRFAKYKTKSGEPANGDEDEPTETDHRVKLIIHTSDPAGARKTFARLEPVAQGVMLARDFVNEPANVLGPAEFAAACRDLEGLGVEVEVLDLDALRELKMGALLGVAQGSSRDPRVVIMQWHGAKSKRTKPLAFVGKGVTFDTGGVSMKPAGGMESMKGDMAGAACVVGLMRALAGRKAAVNVVGVVGLVENMVSAHAQRPGDIVTAMSGQTVEVLNTDAEGRLVLADVMWYTQERFKPKLMIDLATLTGAIIVALGKEFAGLFTSDDKLANELVAAGQVTGERVWRMPLDKSYDKLLNSKNADIKNIGGRNAGAITAAHFLGRFVKGTPWAHLDVAGVAMDSVRNDINQSWASGWGVRLLDRLVADYHERAEK